MAAPPIIPGTDHTITGEGKDPIESFTNEFLHLVMEGEEATGIGVAQGVTLVAGVVPLVGVGPGLVPVLPNTHAILVLIPVPILPGLIPDRLVVLLALRILKMGGDPAAPHLLKIEGLLNKTY
jgi:hypothetical protein